MRTGMAMGLAISLMLGANAVDDAEALQGTWKLSGGEIDGKPLSTEQLRDGKLVIQGDHYSVNLDGRGTVTGTQKLDPTQRVKTIDGTNNTGPEEGQTILGIYELKGNEFRVAFAPPGKERPATFSTTPGSGNWMHVWKRVKE